MMKKKQAVQVRPPVKKEYRFFHEVNRYFTGFIQKETQDFYTIELTSHVAGLNCVWYAGEVVVWPRERVKLLGQVAKKTPVDKDKHRLIPAYVLKKAAD